MSVFVAVYRPNIWSRPTGVAWWDPVDGTVRSAFTNGPDQMLAMDELIGATNQLQFETKAEKLSARTPRIAAWDTADVSIDPQDYLGILQHMKQPA